MRAGDVLVFHSLTAHQGVENRSDRLRMSIDCRFQRVGDPFNPDNANPDGQPLTWEEVYADWRSADLQYYWTRLPLTEVGFDRTWFDRRDALGFELGEAGDPGPGRSCSGSWPGTGTPPSGSGRPGSWPTWTPGPRPDPRSPRAGGLPGPGPAGPGPLHLEPLLEDRLELPGGLLQERPGVAALDHLGEGDAEGVPEQGDVPELGELGPGVLDGLGDRRRPSGRAWCAASRSRGPRRSSCGCRSWPPRP